MRRAAHILAVLAGLAAAQAQTEPAASPATQPTVTITPEAKPDPSIYPYRWAGVELLAPPGPGAAASGSAVVQLRPLEGGPTVRVDVVSPAGQKVVVRAPLPALWPVQQYEVSYADAAGVWHSVAQASVTWPAELVTTDAFIDNSYAAFRQSQPAWTVGLRGQVLLILAMFVVVTAALSLVRWQWLRLAALAVLVGVSAWLVWTAPFWPPALERVLYNLVHATPESGVRTDMFEVVSARTNTVYDELASSPLYPVYRDRGEAAKDTSTVGLDGFIWNIHAAIEAGGTRVTGFGVRLGGGWYSGGWVQRSSDGSVTYDGPSEFGLLVLDDRAWFVNSPPPGPASQPHVLRPEESMPFGQALERHGPDPYTRRLANYWRQRYSRPGRAYLLDHTPGNLMVLELPPRDPATTTSSVITTSQNADATTAPATSPSR